MWRRVPLIVLSLPFAIGAGLLALYLVFGFFLVNPLAQKMLPLVAETKLGSRLSVQQVKFNPITLEATVDGLKLTEPNGQFLAGFERLYLNIGVTGLFRLAWHIQDIQLKNPRAMLAMQSDGKFNWDAVIAKLNKDKKPPSGTMARALIDHVKIDGGSIEYTDANRAGRPFKAVLQPLVIEIDGLSTLPKDHGSYRIAAIFPEQGGTLTLQGDIGLNPLSSKGEFVLEGMRVADLQQAIKSPHNFELSSGTLAADVHYLFAMVRNKTGSDEPSVIVSDVNLSLKNFVLAPHGGNMPAFELTELQIDDANIDLAQRRVEVANVKLTGGRLSAIRSVTGTLDWQTMFAADGEKTAPTLSVQSSPGPSAPEQPWKIAVRAIKLADWAARFTDQGFAKPLVVSANGLGMTAALTGEVGGKQAIEISPINASLGSVRVLSGAQEVASLKSAALVNARLKLAENRLLIDTVELHGMQSTVVVDKNKTLNWAEIMKVTPGAPVPKPAKPVAVKTAAMDKPGMAVQLGRFSLDGIELSIVDQSSKAPVALDVTKGFVTMKNLNLDMNKTVPIEAGFGLKQGGNFHVNGNIIPDKASGKLNLKLVGLSLKPFTSYINRFAKLNLYSGAASVRGKLIFARAEAGMKVDFNGGFAVDDLALTEEETEDPFFGWAKLSSDSLELTLSPNRLHMGELVASQPFSKVVIFEDKDMNLKRILRGSEPEGAAAATAGAPAKTGKDDEAAAAFPLAIERLRIVGADVAFADLSLKPQFGTRMHDLTGVVTGFSNNPATMAMVEIDGKVDEFGSARIRGSVQPFRATDFTDLKLTFRNLEMANMTPYSGKFAGRRVESGKLSVDLEYKVKQRQLAGDNKIVINKLKLGERVDSPEAINIPLDLAIALLEDSDGIIDLDLPVSGNLDDPRFSYGKVIWKAIVNVLTKLVTSPFRALGSLMGISSDKLEAVEFDFGAAALLPPEQEKLKEIGQTLTKRPALTLSIDPAYDLKKDTRAIQEFRIRQDVAQGMGLNVDPDPDPGPVDTANPRAQKVLETIYGDRFDKQGGIKAIKLEYEKHKDSVKTIHADMLERLTLQIPVTDIDLKQLAQSRGQAIQRTLIALGKVDAAKISLGEPVEKDDDGKVVVCKIGLGSGNH